MTKIAERLTLLRQLMQKHKIDFYLIPATDAHNNEYVPECWLRRPWISGFTGSAGEVLVSLNSAYLWTDGRYTLQAGRELDNNLYTLMHQPLFNLETEQWFKANLTGKTLGVDPKVIGIMRTEQLDKIMHSVDGQLLLIDENLVDKCKIQLGEIIKLPSAKVVVQEEKYSGESVGSKLVCLRDKLRNHQADYIALNVLDEIAWLFNLRGADIEYNPLVICYAIIGLNDACIYVDKTKLSSQVLDIFNQNKIRIGAYEDFGNALYNLKGCIWLDNKMSSFWMYQNINKACEVILERSPIVYKKACKNLVEIEGARKAHIKDAVAVINFFHWLYNEWKNGVDELTSGDQVLAFRKQQEKFIGSSFATISGFAANSAVIHYHAIPETNKVINDTNLYLLDSGGQYLEGTTDVTRTVHLGEADSEQKRHYTLVLKGHLALGRSIFTRGTCGEHLDAIARTPLWNEYLNYQHGTGHGVGSYLCVHEGPQGISQFSSGVALVPGMIVSNEPGLYLKNKYGIRIENLCVVSEVNNTEAKSSDYGPFYQFETLTMIPYCKELIDKSMLSPEELNQLKDYYNLIKIKIGHLLNQPVRQWLDSELNIF
ncbi:MAG: aminopeptidase family protein [Burkholderiales bacterium]|nr:aminopeptidase family protein [Burkholderiales bacterium]